MGGLGLFLTDKNSFSSQSDERQLLILRSHDNHATLQSIDLRGLGVVPPRPCTHRLPRATEAIPVGQEMETLQRELLENEVCEDYVQNNVVKPENCAAVLIVVFKKNHTICPQNSR